MMNDDDVVVARASGRETVEELRRSGALDALFERLDAGEVEMTGSQGWLHDSTSSTRAPGVRVTLIRWKPSKPTSRSHRSQRSSDAQQQQVG